MSQQALAQAKASLPGVELQMEEFIAWVTGRAHSFAEGQRINEAYLVWACARGVAIAHAKLEREFISRLRPVIARVERSTAFQDEVLQRVRTRLLVSEAAAPRILTWAGTAPLISWLSAVATRTALNLKREEGHAVEDSDVLESLAMHGPAPELALARAQHGEAFRRAFREAFGTLTARERNVLRLQLIDGLTLERIGALYSVNKSTVSRWLHGCHEVLAARLRSALAESLNLDAGQLDSVIKSMQSNLELSLSVLGSAND